MGGLMELRYFHMAHCFRHIYGGRCCRGHRFWDFPMEALHPHWSLLGELLTTPNTASMWTFFIMWLACFVCADGWCHGDDDPQHFSSTAPLRMETPQPGGGTAHIGNGSLTSAHKGVRPKQICCYRSSFFITTGCVYRDDDQLFSLGKHIG